jgi:DNA repair exonuclease SbcCD ATPase subunit
MIVFKSVQWKNFLSTGNTPNKVNLNSHASTLIVGKNGEGKSTILDALCFGLFGKPFRNIKKNQLVNSINGKNCVVEVELTISNSHYKIIRGAKPNIFDIFLNGDLVNQDAAVKDYQKVLEQQILKLNYKTFTQVVILGSASFVPFMQLPAGQRREVIEDILDIRVFSLMNNLLKEKITETKNEMIELDNKLKLITEKAKAQQKIIDSLTDTKNQSIKTLQDKIQSNKNTITEKSELASNLIGQISDLQKDIQNKESILNDIEKCKSNLSKFNQKDSTIDESIEFFSNNEVCPSCEQGIKHDHKETIIQKLNKSKQEHATKSDLLNEALNKLNGQLEKITQINEEITDLNITLSTENNAITMLSKLNGELEQEIQDLNSNQGDINVEKSTLKAYAEEALKLNGIKMDISKKRNVQDIASILLRDTGIKTQIIKEYLPAMNKLINMYLSAMDFFVKFELDENFNEVIKSRFRDEFTYESFSEGEKMRIDLAILFTWRQIAKMKNSVNTNLLLLDEIFDSSLDVAGTDYFLSVMDKLGENNNIFVISHKGDVLLDKFQNNIRFEKTNDFSKIVENS